MLTYCGTQTLERTGPWIAPRWRHEDTLAMSSITVVWREQWWRAWFVGGDARAGQHRGEHSIKDTFGMRGMRQRDFQAIKSFFWVSRVVSDIPQEAYYMKKKLNILSTIKTEHSKMVNSMKYFGCPRKPHNCWKCNLRPSPWKLLASCPWGQAALCLAASCPDQASHGAELAACPGRGPGQCPEQNCGAWHESVWESLEPWLLYWPAGSLLCVWPCPGAWWLHAASWWWQASSLVSETPLMVVTEVAAPGEIKQVQSLRLGVSQCDFVLKINKRI